MNEHVLITGGTKGIGKAVACCLAKAGYSLVLTYASDTLAAETLRDELVQSYQVKVSLLQADVTIQTSIDVIADFLMSEDIYLKGLILNAGLTPPGRRS